MPSIRLREVDLAKFPEGEVPEKGLHWGTDCNSPAHWDGDTLYLFNSVGQAWRSLGPDLFHLGKSAPVEYHNQVNGGRWIESTWRDDDGTLYGWYHNEPHPVCPKVERLTAPRIGAVISKDNGATWQDFGFVLEAPRDSMTCDTQNYYFSGGNGDFSVILDGKKEYFYFFISTYNEDVREQGVSVARISFSDRKNPVGKVWKWHNGQWNEPGLGGHVTPIFPAMKDWHGKDPDVFWGPSIHWNTHLKQYVILLNCAVDDHWKQEGIYVTFNRDLVNPKGWSTPKKILDAGEVTSDPKKLPGWYPQVMGTAKGETDKLAGRVARLFVHGISRWEITFSKPGDKSE